MTNMPAWRKRHMAAGALIGLLIGSGIFALAWTDPSWIGFKLALIPLNTFLFAFISYVSTE